MTVRRIDITWHQGAYYVSVPNWNGGTVVSASDYDALTSSLAAADARVIALERVISEEMYPENCDDDANRMLLESAIDSHNRRIGLRAALSQTEEWR